MRGVLAPLKMVDTALYIETGQQILLPHGLLSNLEWWNIGKGNAKVEAGSLNGLAYILMRNWQICDLLPLKSSRILLKKCLPCTWEGQLTSWWWACHRMSPSVHPPTSKPMPPNLLGQLTSPLPGLPPAQELKCPPSPLFFGPIPECSWPWRWQASL